MNKSDETTTEEIQYNDLLPCVRFGGDEALAENRRLGFPDPPPEDQYIESPTRIALKYSSDQPRDERGRFGEGGGPSGARTADWSSAGAQRGEDFLLGQAPGSPPLPGGLSAPVASMLASGALRSAVKAEVVTKLTDRLMASQEFKEYANRTVVGNSLSSALIEQISNAKTPEEQAAAKEAFSRGKVESLVNTYVGAWAGTSADTSDTSIGIQLAAEREFGLTQPGTAHPWETSLSKGYQPYQQEGEAMAMQHFVRAQYDETQAAFRAAGINELSLARGFGSTARLTENLAAAGADGRETRVNLQPVSSFSTDPAVSERFARGAGGTHSKGSGAVMFLRVPVSHILSTSRTGVGCLSEGEITVLGGRATARFVLPNQVAAFQNRH